jgi:hypothetical protein
MKKRNPQWPLTRFQTLVVCAISILANIIYNHLGYAYYLAMLGIISVGAVIIIWRRSNKKDSS